MPQLVTVWDSGRTAVLTAVDPASHSNRAAGLSERITPIDHDRRGTSESDALGLALVSDHTYGDRYAVQPGIGKHLLHQSHGRLGVRAVGHGQYFYVHTFIVARLRPVREQCGAPSAGAGHDRP